MEKFQSSWTGMRSWVIPLILALMGSVHVLAQSPPYTVKLSGFNTASANLDQARNGAADDPVSPVDWVNGNAGASNAHYIEGFSIPYRIVMRNLPTTSQIVAAGGADGKVHMILEYDIRNSNKHAVDYLTGYQRLEPHTQFTNIDPTHLAEEVNPLYDPSTGFLIFNGTTPTPSMFPIPEPPTPGSDPTAMPRPSFNHLPPSERMLVLWGGQITNISYGPAGDLTAKNAPQLIYISFIPTGGTALLSFGGHIASRLDWGPNESASGISGSPYHMHLVDWNLNNLGNQDRSLSTAAVIVFPPCEISGPKWICTNDSGPFIYTADVSTMPGARLSYLWSLFDNTAGASIVSGTQTQQQAYINPGTTGGSFKVKVVITDLDTRVSSTCYLHDMNGSDSMEGALPVQVVAVSVDAVATDVSCYGLQNGTLAVTGSGYSSLVLFKDGTQLGDTVTTAGSYTFTGLAPGSYVVRAYADSLSCNKASDPDIIRQPPQVSVSVSSKDITCYGAADGSVTVTGSGYTNLKLFLNGVLSSTVTTTTSPYNFSGLSPGSYYVEASAQGYRGATCSVTSGTENVEQPAQITIRISSTDVTCYGEGDGSVTATGSGYTSLKLYRGSEVVGTVTTTTSPYVFSNLTPGVYKVEAIAAGNERATCNAMSGTESIEQPEQVTVRITAQDVVCNGESNGSVTVYGDGYSRLELYDESERVQTSSTSSNPYVFENLPPGSYKVIAFGNGNQGAECQAESSTLRINEPALISCQIAEPEFDKPVCGTHQSNVLEATAQGGTGTITYSWSVNASNPTDQSRWGIWSGQGTNSIIFRAGNYPATFILTVTDVNGCDSQCSIEVRGCASEYYCTYTQGFYGNTGGKGCSAQGEQSTALQMMTSVLPSGSTNFGNGSKRFELFSTDLTNGNIFKMLPGGKTPAALKGYATYSVTSTWPNVPIERKGSNDGKIANNLLSQTMVLYFNIGQNLAFNLASLKITGPYLITAKAENCGTRLAIPYEDLYTIIPQGVIDYMSTAYASSGGATVGNLLRLANHILGGGSAGSLTPSMVNSAVDAINRGFDECRVFIEFSAVQPGMIASRNAYIPKFAGADELSDQPSEMLKDEPSKLKANAYFNPFGDKAIISFTPAENTTATVQVFSLNGVKVKDLFQGAVEGGRNYEFEFNDSAIGGTVFIYRIVTPLGSQVGRLIRTRTAER